MSNRNMLAPSWKDIAPYLSPNTLTTLKSLNFHSPTPVQAAVIPHFLKNRDVVVEAVTGSGKTLAFLIPMLEKLYHLESQQDEQVHQLLAVIITPTRELAYQIDMVLREFIVDSKLKKILVVGGYNSDKDIFRMVSTDPHIIVATPGKLSELMKRKDNGDLSRRLKYIEVLILDEADRLLEMGFEESLTTILSYLPKQRRTCLFSATQTQEVEKLIRLGLRNPVRINVKEKASLYSTPISLHNYYVVTQAYNKLHTLVAFLKQNQFKKIMVFMATCAGVIYFSELLAHFTECSVKYVHGKMKDQRYKVFEEFRISDFGVLVCTDVMARGIDIPLVDWVVQFDPPSMASSFVHRVGRTARCGEEGSSLIFLLPNETSYVQFLSYNQKVAMKEFHINLIKDFNLVDRIREKAMKEREIYEGGILAFVSFIQFYAKHDCYLIFQLKELDFGGLASGYGLLHLPSMPEIRRKKVAVLDFTSVEMDYTSIRYKNKAREKARKIRLAKIVAKPKRIAIFKRFQNHNKTERISNSKLHRKSKEQLKNTIHKFSSEELAELTREARLIKKLKSGKISKTDFDKLIKD